MWLILEARGQNPSRHFVKRYGEEVSESRRLPIFPLGSVFFPLTQIPLRIFEERYRVMTASLLAKPAAERRFVLIGIREGYEVGTEQTPALHDVGVEVLLTSAEGDVANGYDIEVTATHRVVVLNLDDSEPLLQGDVVRLTADPYAASAANAHEAANVRDALDSYLATLQETTGMTLQSRSLPEDPEALSYVLAGHLPLLSSQQQTLLETNETGERLTLLRHLLRTETAAMRVVPSVPAHDLIRQGWSPN